MAGNLSVETCGYLCIRFTKSKFQLRDWNRRQSWECMSKKKNRAWTSSSAANDNQAVTIEVANDQIGGDWHVSDTALNKLIELCVDICKRNGIEKLNLYRRCQPEIWQGTICLQIQIQALIFAEKFPTLPMKVNKRLRCAPVQPPCWLKVYRVQTGAFSNKANAVALESKLKAQGFDTYIVQVGNLYKVQVGAFGVKANADAMLAKLKGAGYDAFVTTNSGNGCSSDIKWTLLKGWLES